MAINHVELTEQSTRAFTEVLSTVDTLDRPVTSCPGWTVEDLVKHLGVVQIWWTRALRGGGEQPSAPDDQPGPDLREWWRQRSEEFLATVRATPPDAPSWCWWNDERRDTASTVVWRQAHEAVVHLWDLESTLGRPRPIDPEVAADGIDEFVARMLPSENWQGPEGVLQLRAEDLGRVWTFAQNSGVPELLRDKRSRPATATLSATVEQLYLLLWRRMVPVEPIEELARAFLAWPSLG